MKRKLRTAGLILAVLLMLTACAGTSNTGNVTNGNSKENVGMDYENAILKGVEYSWNNSMMARNAFSVNLSENEIIRASYYPLEYEPDDYDIKSLANVKISADQWKDICAAVDILKPVLKEINIPNQGDLNDTDGIQELDGYTQDFAITWEIDGKTVRKAYCIPENERFCVLKALLEELVNPTGQEIPVYTPPVLNGAFFSDGAEKGYDHFSFQCTVKEENPGKYRFYCYYPVDGKEVRYPTEEVDETVWAVIRDKIEELAIENMETGNSKEQPCISLYYSNGRQYVYNPDKETAEELKKMFFELIGEKPVAAKKSFFSRLFGK